MASEELPKLGGMDVSEGTSALLRPAPPLQSLSTDRVKFSTYSTGVLTESGWTPIESSTWKVVLSERGELLQAAKAEVDGLLKCHEEECRRLSETTTAPEPSLASDNIGHHPGPSQTSSPAISEDHLDYGSYFRHAGWTECASIAENHGDSTRRPVTTAEPESSSYTYGANPNTTHTDKTATSTAFENSSTRAMVVEGRKEEFAAGGEKEDPVSEVQPMQQVKAVKQVKAFFHPEEDAWLLLFHSKIKAAAEAGHNIKLPGPSAVLANFNAFFVGRIMQDERGADLPPRRPREENSMKGKIAKMHSKIWHLRDVTRRLLEGKRGGTVYVPEITADELRQYRVHEKVSL